MGAGAVCGVSGPMFSRGYAYHLRVERKTLKLPRWNADGFKVCFISDFHLNGPRQLERAKQALQVAYDEKPDLVALGGDFVEHGTEKDTERMRDFARATQTDKCPTVAILGNHDYWSGAGDMVIDELRRADVRVLQNQLFEIQGVTVAGIDDGIDNRQRFDFFNKGAVSKSLLCLLHEPDFVEEQPDHVSLQLSGHSHGGQICGPGGVHLHAPKYGRKYVAGFFEPLPVPLYVSRGVGTTGPDMRTFCAPEVSVLTLRST